MILFQECKATFESFQLHVTAATSCIWLRSPVRKLFSLLLKNINYTKGNNGYSGLSSWFLFGTLGLLQMEEVCSPNQGASTCCTSHNNSVSQLAHHRLVSQAVPALPWANDSAHPSKPEMEKIKSTPRVTIHTFELADMSGWLLATDDHAGYWKKVRAVTTCTPMEASVPSAAVGLRSERRIAAQSCRWGQAATRGHPDLSKTNNALQHTVHTLSHVCPCRKWWTCTCDRHCWQTCRSYARNFSWTKKTLPLSWVLGPQDLRELRNTPRWSKLIGSPPLWHSS